MSLLPDKGDKISCSVKHRECNKSSTAKKQANWANNREDNSNNKAGGKSFYTSPPAQRRWLNHLLVMT